MKSLPDLDRLSVAEKDDLIRSLFARVQELTAKVAELEGRLAQNSRNSSKPPSSDGYGKPKPKSLRTPGKNPTGGQKGHEGHILKKAERPDHIVTHAPPPTCDESGSLLLEPTGPETRQAFDLPPPHYKVTEHRVLKPRSASAKCHQAPFPEGVNPPVHY